MKINTDKVRQTANDISNYNKKIDEEFKSVENAISYLKSGWVSTAKDYTSDKFDKIKNNYINNKATRRNQAIENYVKFLKEYIGDIYDEVETKNTNLADAFK